jgi:hypothetical protein
VVANALRLLGSIRWQHETTWVSQGPSYLFDAAAFGVRVGPDDRLDIGLEPGPYIVRSAYAGSGGVRVRAGPDPAHTGSPGATVGSREATVELDGMAGASGPVSDGLAGLDP